LYSSSSEKGVIRAINHLGHNELLEKMSAARPNQKQNNDNNNPTGPISIATKCKNCGAEIKSGIMTFNSEQSFNMTRFFTQSVEDCPNCGEMATYTKNDYYILKG
jgi:hypothetical protein